MDPSHFILNSDYPMEKIIYFYEFSDTVPARSSMEDPAYEKTIDLPQFKEVPLFFGISATQSDFSDSLATNGDSVGADSSNKPAFNIHGFRKDDGTCQLVIDQLAQNYTGADTQFYMRIYGLAQTGNTDDLLPTQQSSGPFLISTDYNYLPLIFSGRFDTDISATGTKEFSVEFGYQEVIDGGYEKIRIKYPNTGNLPVVMVWNEGQTLGNTEYGFPTSFEVGTINPIDPPIIIDQDNRIIELNLPNAVRAGYAVRMHVRVYMP